MTYASVGLQSITFYNQILSLENPNLRCERLHIVLVMYFMCVVNFWLAK